MFKKCIGYYSTTNSGIEVSTNEDLVFVALFMLQLETPQKKFKKSNIQGQLAPGLWPVLEQRGFWALWFVWISTVCNAGLLVSRNYSVFAARFGLDFLVLRFPDFVLADALSSPFFTPSPSFIPPS